ncbi:NAD(P)-dependent oxidoreductase [Novosphingobium beihaiensis]|uniref:NAD(P)-binding domain-containing protein n=1 Tax=Novosphingobium beihaiensis TaxID=2930389 RepID=A0ABT0BRF7_9SPHN|nr:NAD(P)-dependent oxidoreductase [Novosphingobium beihaiensis]MCJ2187655.1 NAD(P)-binding domain-containing protein [Novosphingobium beihaiensis]
MANPGTIHGVLLSDTFDLKSFYNLDLAGRADDVRLFNPDEVTDPAAIRFAVCWLPGAEAFAPYPNLEMAMSVGAGVDDLLGHPGLDGGVAICRVRDPYQADLMAGFAVHEVLHVERDFHTYQGHQSAARWDPLPLRPPHHRKVAVLGHGSMGAAVTQALAALGFTVSVACRRPPREPVKGVAYFTGEDAIAQAVTGVDTVVNVLPLTPQTHGILNRNMFGRLAPGAWLVQIGRGEHLHAEDFVAALDSGQLSGASLDVFAQEPLPPGHAFWQDPRLRITPHIASDTTPHVVSEQALQSARELLAGKPLSLAVDRAQGY